MLDLPFVEDEVWRKRKSSEFSSRKELYIGRIQIKVHFAGRESVERPGVDGVVVEREERVWRYVHRGHRCDL